MRSRGIPQFTVDAHRPVSAFDVLGVSFSTELGYTNLLTALDLAGIRGRRVPRYPTRSCSPAATRPSTPSRWPTSWTPSSSVTARKPCSPHPHHPRVEAGRPRWWAGRPPARPRRDRRRLHSEVLRRDVPPRRPHRPGRSQPPRCPASVRKHTLLDLDAWPYPKAPVVPVAETVHERYSVEIFRGCTRGCRVCQAGMITRPVRERSITTVGNMVKAASSRPASPRSACCRCQAPTTARSTRSPIDLADCYEGSKVGLSLPSTRVDAFNVTLATNCRGTASAPA